MKVYWFNSLDKGYHFDINYGPDDFEMNVFSKNLGRKRFNGDWPTKLKLRCIKPRGYSDFPDISHCLGPIVRKNVLDALPKYFQEECEPIPFTFKKETFYLLNVPIVEGAILEKKQYHVTASAEEKLQGYDYDYHFQWCVFDKEKIKGHNFFQSGLLYASEEFKQKFEQLGIQGATFREVWDSDEGTEPKLARMVAHLKTLYPPRKITPEPQIITDFNRLRFDELREKIVSMSAEQVFEYAKDCEAPAELQMMWFFDGQHIELACYIESEDIENELILTNDKTIDSMMSALLQTYILEHPEENVEETADNGSFGCELQKLCLAVCSLIEKHVSSSIKIIEPGEYD